MDLPKKKLIKTHMEDDTCKAVIKQSSVRRRPLQTEECSILKPLPSREKEIEWLDNFLTECLDKQKSGSLYISGQPGTGKTASLSYILQLPKFKLGYKQIYINCTMVKSAATIYKRICQELQLQTSGCTVKACSDAIERYLTRKQKMLLLVLDEIDQLVSRGHSVLYSIFEWASLRGSGVVVVGAANALDLPQRALRRLEGPRRALAPRTLHFAPYTKEQIIHIFTSALATEDNTRLFSTAALHMLAAKIASVSGDMRRALHIGRRVIELAKRNKFSENKCVDSLMQDATVTVELKEVLQVLNKVYGGCKKIETEMEEGFPLQQKLILCSLMLMLTKGKNKDIAMGKLYDVYKRVALARNIVPLEMSEMASACALLEASGAVRVSGGGAGLSRARRVHLHWDEEELSVALKDKPLLAAILSDHSALTAA